MVVVSNTDVVNIWLGASEEEPYQWIWLTSRDVMDMNSWTGWVHSEPNNVEHTNYCLHIWYPNSGWADSPCGLLYTSYCEYI